MTNIIYVDVGLGIGSNSDYTRIGYFDKSWGRFVEKSMQDLTDARGVAHYIYLMITHFNYDVTLCMDIAGVSRAVYDWLLDYLDKDGYTINQENGKIIKKARVSVVEDEATAGEKLLELILEHDLFVLHQNDKGRRLGKTTAIIKLIESNPDYCMLVNTSNRKMQLLHFYPLLESRIFTKNQVLRGDTAGLDKSLKFIIDEQIDLQTIDKVKQTHKVVGGFTGLRSLAHAPSLEEMLEELYKKNIDKPSQTLLTNTIENLLILLNK